MKFIKLKSIEILTNGSLNFTKTSFIKSYQISMHKKDYKSLSLTQKTKEILKYKSFNNFYRAHYKT